MPYEDRAGGISIHAVDIAEGRPAVGLFVTIAKLDGDIRIPVTSGWIGGDGQLDDPIRSGEGIGTGIYEIVFDMAAYYRAAGRPTCLELAPFRFHLATATEHMHLPLKFTPSGVMLFRGA